MNKINSADLKLNDNLLIECAALNSSTKADKTKNKAMVVGLFDACGKKGLQIDLLVIELGVVWRWCQNQDGGQAYAYFDSKFI